MKLRWTEPRYVNDGDYVWLPLSFNSVTGATRVLRCIVSCACGNSARIRRLPFGEDEWHYLKELLVPPKDPRNYDYEYNITVGDSA